MPTNISIGFSQHADPSKAILQACVQVKNQLNTAETDLVIIFASPEYVVPEIQTTIMRSLKPKQLVGSSAGGLLFPNGLAHHGIVLAGINSDDMSFGVSAISDIDNQDMHYIGFDLARKAAQGLRTSHHREVFLSFSEGIEKNNSQFIRGVKESLGGGFPVLGAISSDDFKYKELSQFFQDQILHHSAVGLLLGGVFHLSLGCKHGFKPLGKPRTITKLDGHIIRTIDNKPAIEIYKHFMGAEAEGIKNTALNSYTTLYPLGFYLKERRQYLLRNLIDILEDGSIVCHEGIPPGAEVHLMISNSESCLSSAIEAAKLAKASLAERQPKLVIVFESLFRHKILGRTASSEIQAIKNVLGQATPIIGMCSYGEIGPFGTLNDIKNVYLHNGSILIVAIS